MNINKAILNANDLLRKNNIKSAKLDSEILMAKAIDKKREYIILNSDNQLTKKNYEYYQHLINQRLNGKPIAYILGKKDFWKYEFKIMEGVLIPRPDSS